MTQQTEPDPKTEVTVASPHLADKDPHSRNVVKGLARSEAIEF